MSWQENLANGNRYRSNDEATKISGSKGGKKSGETRRKKADMQKAFRDLMNAQLTGEMRQQLEKQGVKNPNYGDAMAFSMIYQAVQKGNVKAFEAVMTYAGIKPPEPEKKKETKRENDGFIEALQDSAATDWENGGDKPQGIEETENGDSNSGTV